MLARWKQPPVDIYHPRHFIPLAEKCRINRSAYAKPDESGCQTDERYRGKLPEGFHIGINFSASHIISPTFVDECKLP
ncbi:hypothetical protein [Klebsiella pneumoniae]|uniref:hypothetical protein n=1 Tax=Klebsiella pneumoniae TaxID=573 RepID=UPI00388EBE96